MKRCLLSDVVSTTGFKLARWFEFLTHSSRDLDQALLHEPGTHLTASGALATLSGETKVNAHCMSQGLQRFLLERKRLQNE